MTTHQHCHDQHDRKKSSNPIILMDLFLDVVTPIIALSTSPVYSSLAVNITGVIAVYCGVSSHATVDNPAPFICNTCKVVFLCDYAWPRTRVDGVTRTRCTNCLVSRHPNGNTAIECDIKLSFMHKLITKTISDCVTRKHDCVDLATPHSMDTSHPVRIWEHVTIIMAYSMPHVAQASLVTRVRTT